MNKRDYFFGSQAAELPPPAPVKAPSGAGGQAVPAYLGKAKGAKISNSVSNITNLSLATAARNQGTMNEVIKKLVLTSPDLSNAVATKINSAVSENYVVYAKGPDGRIDIPGTQAVQTVMMRFDLGSHDYTRFTRSYDLRSIVSSLLNDSFRYGGMAAELVLGKTRMPAFIKPFSARLTTWADNTPESYPIYKGPDGEVHLNFPTVHYSCTVQDMETAYADSPLQTAIQACLWDSEFADDLRRAATKNLLQRLKVTIKTEAYIKTLPADVQVDKEKMKLKMASLVSRIEDQLAGLEPDDSLVLFDMMEADTISDANRSEDKSITVLQDLINGKISSGAKILPAIIGRGASANAASTESMLFLKSVASAQLEINKLLSRLLTLAVRLMGFDVYVVFALDEVNLRPGLELESFKAIKQARHLELLSLGMETDEYTSIKLTGMLPPIGYNPLAGTMFKYTSADTTNNDYSNTSVDNSGKTDSTQAQKDGAIK
jgi:hypothetical protein